MTDLYKALADALSTEVKQRQQTDWGSILANSLAQGALGAAKGFAEAKPNDYGSQLASALVGGLSTGYGQGRQRKIANDVTGSFANILSGASPNNPTDLMSALKKGGFDNSGNIAAAVTLTDFENRNNLQNQFNLQNQRLGFDKGMVVQNGKFVPIPSYNENINRQKYNQASATASGRINTENRLKPQTENVAAFSKDAAERAVNDMAIVANNDVFASMLKKVPVKDRVELSKDISNVKMVEDGIQKLKNEVDGMKKLVNNPNLINPLSLEAAEFKASSSSLQAILQQIIKGNPAEREQQRLMGMFPQLRDMASPEGQEILDAKLEKLAEFLRRDESSLNTPTLNRYFGTNAREELVNTFSNKGGAFKENQRETKKVGGKTYEKFPQGWKEVKK